MALEILNRRPGMTANQMAIESGLSRGTAFRVLETLRNLNYLDRDEKSGGYWLQQRVCALADGFNDEAWVHDIARPVVERLGHDLVWPVTLTTPFGVSMLVRLNTDYQSALSKNRFPVGHRVSLVASASGIAFLAASDPSRRALFLELIRRSVLNKETLKTVQSPVLRTDIARVEKDGFAVLVDGDRSAVAVAIVSRGQPFACLTLRYFTSAVPPRQIKKEILPLLKAAAAQIARDFEAGAPANLSALQESNCIHSNSSASGRRLSLPHI